MTDPAATPFLTDIQEIRRRAREHVMKGAVTPAYKGNVHTAIKLPAIAADDDEEARSEKLPPMSAAPPAAPAPRNLRRLIPPLD